jgi:hypothetical protein
MDTLSDNIKLWLTYDNKISEINNYNKNLKEKKQTIETNIIDLLKYNNLSEKEIKINNFKINVHNSSTPAALSLKIIEESLLNIVDEKTKNLILENIKLNRLKNKSNSIVLKKKIIRNKRTKNK